MLRVKELESKLRPFLARRVPSADADDVMQDVFLRMHRGLTSLRDEERFGPWVYRIARNAIVDHLRKQRVPTEDIDIAIDREPEEDEHLLAPYVASFVAELPSPYREALTLTELQGMTQKDAAAMLGISVSGMKSRVQRGRVLLRAAFEECCAIALDVRGRVIECTPRKTDCCR